MRFCAAILWSLLVWPCAAAENAPPLTPDQKEVNLQSFEYVWTTVRDKHWDPKLGGLDWQAVHDELRPAVERAKTMEQARAAMTAMLARLKQTHFNIVPSDVYGEMKGTSKDESAGNGSGSPGIELRVIDGKALVVEVEPDSPAAAAGVRPGWEIVKIDGRDVTKGLQAIARKQAGSTLLEIMLVLAVGGRLTGEIGTPVKVEFRDSGDRRVERTLDRVSPRGTLAHLGNLPPMYFWVEARRMRPAVGYLRFNLFFEPDTLMSALTRIMKECDGCRGFVIDLRGNPGGIGGLATGLAGWFMDRGGTELGAMHLRTGLIRFAVFARPHPFRGPLAILVDGCSGSTSEIFAGGMQDLKRARIFGTRTAGAALPSVFERLPNGDGFQYAIANYISQGGKALEGAGVIPDEEVKLTRRALLDGRDPVLERALAWIETTNQETSR